jgi:hypothetical protein
MISKKMKKENLLIHPTEKRSFKDSFVMIWYALLFFAFAELIFPIFETKRNYHAPFSGSFFWVMLMLVIVVVLSQKIYQVIEFDYEKETFVATYTTLFKNNCQMVVPFEKLAYNYSLIIAKTTKIWTLNIWYNDKNVFTLAEGDSGFDKETLDMIAEKLKELEE